MANSLLLPRRPQSSREGYSFEQIHAITRVVLATLLELAGFSL